MNVRRGVLLFAVALLVVPTVLADTISPNTTTPLGPGFVLVTTPATPGMTGVINPQLTVGITGGGLTTTQTLDLSNPSAPVLDSVLDPAPSPDVPQNFSIFLGLVVPPSTAPQFTFGMPVGGPDSSGDYRWTATMGDATLIGQFMMSTPGGVITSWTVVPQPDVNGVDSSFEIDFTVTPTAMTTDPLMTLNLMEEVNGQSSPLNFTAVPEPPTAALLACALAAVAAAGAFRRRLPDSR